MLQTYLKCYVHGIRTIWLEVSGMVIKSTYELWPTWKCYGNKNYIKGFFSQFVVDVKK